VRGVVPMRATHDGVSLAEASVIEN
jgi:hypothetical protein